MSDILNQITARLREGLPALKQANPVSELKRRISSLPPAPDFAVALKRRPDFGVIAEVKKASPSKGLIREDFQPLELALELEAAGAAALSVLTEPNYFLGRLAYLAEISGKVKIPVLRKDFIFDAYQLYEARAAGAAAVLLIAALLDDRQLAELTALAHDLGLQVLGEAHDAEELDRLLNSEADLIGVNARNLHSFQTDLAAMAQLLSQIPKARVPVAESAIRSHADLLALQAAGATGFLIGETLMRSASPGRKLRELLGGTA